MTDKKIIQANSYKLDINLRSDDQQQQSYILEQSTIWDINIQ